ncbi:prepilin peptidase [Yokenella regensburgei]|uniref:prepilin peptidase n=1 Tax=Yokenella regensburgei TaxID=158877 RepID=UPI001432DCF7|nr:prepilin peptidase [Yokenella regensburgei]QIU90105.1 prepilin peptidase [Yokenella regensburgei]
MKVAECIGVFWFAVIFTSLLNCIVYRYICSEDHSFACFTRRSYCERCKISIPLIYIIPIFGFVFSGFKCSHCKISIPIYHIITEFLSGVVGLLFYILLNTEGLVLYYLLLVLIAIAIIDAKIHIIPPIFTIPLLIYGVFFFQSELPLLQRIYGALCCLIMVTLSMIIVSLIKKENIIAGGDIALFTSAGAWLGVHYVPILILLSTVVFIIYALPARLRGRVYTPMGPSISIGFYLCILLHLLS